MPRSLNPRVYTSELFEQVLIPIPGQCILALGIAASVVVAWGHVVGPQGVVMAVEHWLPDFRALEIEAQQAHLPMQMIASSKEMIPTHKEQLSLEKRSSQHQLAIYFTASLAILGKQTFDIC